MTLGDVKKTAYALIDEYSSDETIYTEDEDLASKINLIANICYHELSGIKPIIRTIAIDRSTAGTTDYNRAYSLPSDMKKLLQVTAYDATTNKPINPEFELRWGVGTTVGETTTYSNKIYINDQFVGNVFIVYEAYPTIITETTLDTMTLELDTDVLMLLPFAIASDILKSDVSADYGRFQQRYQDQLSKFDVRKTRGLIEIEPGCFE